MAAIIAMMGSSPAASDFFLLIKVICIGIGIAFAYDGLRICRNTIPHNKQWVDREDLVFTICTGLLFFDWMVRNAKGILRITEIISVALGIFLYEYLISAHLVKIGTFLLAYLIKTMKILVFPVGCCIKWLKKQCKRGKIKIYAHLDFTGEKKKNRGEQRTNGKSRI